MTLVFYQCFMSCFKRLSTGIYFFGSFYAGTGLTEVSDQKADSVDVDGAEGVDAEAVVEVASTDSENGNLTDTVAAKKRKSLTFASSNNTFLYFFFHQRLTGALLNCLTLSSSICSLILQWRKTGREARGRWCSQLGHHQG